MSKTKGGKGDGEMLENKTTKEHQCLRTLPDAKVMKGKQPQSSSCNKRFPGTPVFFIQVRATVLQMCQQHFQDSRTRALKANSLTYRTSGFQDSRCKRGYIFYPLKCFACLWH